jgi:hypothetical protein
MNYSVRGEPGRPMNGNLHFASWVGLSMFANPNDFCECCCDDGLRSIVNAPQPILRLLKQSPARLALAIPWRLLHPRMAVSRGQAAEEQERWFTKINHSCHCEGGAFPPEAISCMVSLRNSLEVASPQHGSAHAMRPFL